MTTVPLPKQIQRRANDLLTIPGTEVEATVLRPGVFRIVHTSDRVRCTFDYRRNSGKQLSYHCTLEVDGKRRKLMPDWKAYTRLFANPDNPHPERTQVQPLPEVTPLTGDEELPPALVRLLDRLKEKGDECRRTLGTVVMPDTGETMYVLCSEHRNEPGSFMHLYFSPTTHAYCGMSAVDAYGGDALRGMDQAKIIREWLGVTMPWAPAAAAPPAQRRTDTAGAASNAVAVRRTTVIRV